MPRIVCVLEEFPAAAGRRRPDRRRRPHAAGLARPHGPDVRHPPDPVGVVDRRHRIAGGQAGLGLRAVPGPDRAARRQRGAGRAEQLGRPAAARHRGREHGRWPGRTDRRLPRARAAGRVPGPVRRLQDPVQPAPQAVARAAGRIARRRMCSRGSHRRNHRSAFPDRDAQSAYLGHAIDVALTPVTFAFDGQARTPPRRHRPVRDRRRACWTRPPDRLPHNTSPDRCRFVLAPLVPAADDVGGDARGRPRRGRTHGRRRRGHRVAGILSDPSTHDTYIVGFGLDGTGSDLRRMLRDGPGPRVRT